MSSVRASSEKSSKSVGRMIQCNLPYSLSLKPYLERIDVAAHMDWANLLVLIDSQLDQSRMKAEFESLLNDKCKSAGARPHALSSNVSTVVDSEKELQCGQTRVLFGQLSLGLGKGKGSASVPRSAVEELRVRVSGQTSFTAAGLQRASLWRQWFLGQTFAVEAPNPRAKPHTVVLVTSSSPSPSPSSSSSLSDAQRKLAEICQNNEVPLVSGSLAGASLLPVSTSPTKKSQSSDSSSSSSLSSGGAAESPALALCQGVNSALKVSLLQRIFADFQTRSRQVTFQEGFSAGADFGAQQSTSAVDVADTRGYLKGVQDARQQKLDNQATRYASLPLHLCCPITMSPMREPVLSPTDGVSFEQAAILTWVREGTGRHPLNGRPLKLSQLVHNHLYTSILTWLNPLWYQETLRIREMRQKKATKPSFSSWLLGQGKELVGLFQFK